MTVGKDRRTGWKDSQRNAEFDLRLRSVTANFH